MSDQDESRPLTRRELRLREMAAAGAEPEAPEPVVEDAPVETPGDAAEAVASSADEAEIEISLFDENGRMRSRRELRELRAQAEERAAAEAAAGSAVEAEAVVEAEAAVETEAAVEPSAGEQPEAAQEETEEAESEAIESEAVEAEAGEQVGVQPEPAGEAENETEAAPEPIVEPELAEGLEQLGFEQPGADAPGSEPKPDTQASEEPLAETVAFDVIAEEQAVETEPAVTGEVILEDEQDVAVGEEIAAEAAVEAAAPEEPAAEERSPAPVPAQPSQGYSFPDIAPLDEGQSVFDDPAIRMMGAAGAQQAAEPAGGDFDELINRAVAQEGASSTSNTSALILPNMPESEGLASPLGDTGELFITGSIDLPKSLGETGGHSALHDSVEIEPLDELGISETAPAGGGMAPVSASRAVSARGSQGSLVADASKDKSKMPVVLIATGGVLVLGAVGLIVWAATSGLFG